MAQKYQYTGKVLDGGLLSCRGGISAKLKELVGESITVTIEKAKKKRSSPQNRYYYGVVIPNIRTLFAEHGSLISADDVHLFLKGEIGGMTKQIRKPNGDYMTIVDTSTKLSTTEWEDWMSAIRSWASQFGCDIPEPNEPKGRFNNGIA